MAAPTTDAGEDTVRLPAVRDVPTRADGVELIGAYQGSGYVDGKYLVGRADGQMIQLPRLLYRLAELLDGRRDTAQLAAALSTDSERTITAEQVEFLLDERLRPAGVAAQAVGAPEPDAAHAVVAARPDPFLALRHRAPLCSARATWRIAGPLLWLHRPAVVALALLTFLALQVTLVVTGAPGQVVPAATELIYQPFLTLVVLATMLTCFVFHEFGHASACRYGGARPGSMGVGLYLIWPAVYTTVTDAYRLSRAGRLRTDLGGVYFNALFLSALAALYLATGQAWVLVAIVVLHVETLMQFLPSVRFDGYYILSDLIGLPDLFMYLVPVVRSAIPGAAPDPRVALLRPWVRRVITFWVLAVIPCLLLMLGLFLAAAPHTLPVLFAVIGGLIAAVGEAARAGETATATLGVLQIVFVVLPWVGSALVVWMITGQIRGAVDGRKRRAAAAPAPGPGVPSPGPAAASPAPVRSASGPRHARDEADEPGQLRPQHGAGSPEPSRAGDPTGWFLAAMPAVVLFTMAGVAALGERVTAAGETLLAAAAGAATGTSAPVGELAPATAFGVRQLAALAALLNGLGAEGVTDGLRAALLAAAAVGAGAVWAMARRVGLSAPAATVAAVLAVAPAPALALHGTVDPAVLAAVWLTVGVATFGSRPGRTGFAVVALLVGVLTAPPALVAVAAFVAHRLWDRDPATTVWGRRRRLAAVGVVGLLGVLAAALTLAPGGPLRTDGAFPVPPSVLVPMLVAGLVGVAPALGRRTAVAPLGSAVAALLVWAVAVPSSAGTALLLALPGVAVLLAGTLDVVFGAIRRTQGQLALLAVLAVVAVTSWPTVLAAFGTAPARDTLAGWARTELGGAVLRADPLTTVELTRAGIDPARLLPQDAAGAGPAALTVHADRPGDPRTVPAGEILFAAPRGPDGAPVTVLRPTPGAPADADPADERAAVGRDLADNPNLRWEGNAADRLRSGEVDERLVVVLSGLSETHELTVAGFDRAPGEPDGVPARTARVTVVDDVPVVRPGAVDAVRAWLDGQLPRFRPDRVQFGPDRDALVVHFPVEPPGSTS